jgi:hypothetical protein
MRDGPPVEETAGMLLVVEEDAGKEGPPSPRSYLMVTPSWTPSSRTWVTECLQGKRKVKNKVHTWNIASPL